MLVYSEEETKLIKINKKPSEIISVDFDFKTLENKIYTWFYQSNKLYKPSYPLLFLNDEETKVFLKSYATAVLYFTKQKYNCISQQQQLELKALFKVLMFELN
ncbi:MAG: hypothetical protein Q8L81_14395 [Bacteroidota bacterium]|nr:hypothetical protein [Bacteroidota bacterium]